MIHIFYLVFSQLAVGGLGLLLIVPKGLVGRGYFRLMGTIYLLVMILTRFANLTINRQPINLKNFVFSWSGQDSAFVAAFLFLVLIYTISLWMKSHLISRVLLIAGTILGLTWIVFSAQGYLGKFDLPAETFLLPVQFLVSSVLLGAVNSGMWFGHWYLVPTPRLPVVHLKRFNLIFIVSLVISISLFALNLFLRWHAENAVPLTPFHHIVFSLRLLVGFGGSVHAVPHNLVLPARQSSGTRCRRRNTGCHRISLHRYVDRVHG